MLLFGDVVTADEAIAWIEARWHSEPARRSTAPDQQTRQTWTQELLTT
jgi:hypothetical protein